MNVRAAIVHAIGDLLQSIGVIIAAVVILIWPEAKIVDPICTYLFSVLVMFTTIPVFRDCVTVLMEQQPSGLDSEAIKQEMLDIKGIHSVNDLHIWTLSGGKNCISAHIFLKKIEDTKSFRATTHKIYHKLGKVMKKHDICH